MGGASTPPTNLESPKWPSAMSARLPAQGGRDCPHPARLRREVNPRAPPVLRVFGGAISTAQPPSRHRPPLGLVGRGSVPYVPRPALPPCTSTLCKPPQYFVPQEGVYNVCVGEESGGEGRGGERKGEEGRGGGRRCCYCCRRRRQRRYRHRHRGCRCHCWLPLPLLPLPSPLLLLLLLLFLPLPLLRLLMLPLLLVLLVPPMRQPVLVT